MGGYHPADTNRDGVITPEEKAAWQAANPGVDFGSAWPRDGGGNGFKTPFGTIHASDLNPYADGNAVKDAARGKLNEVAGAAFGNYNAANGLLQGTYGQLNDAMGYLRDVGMGRHSVAAEQLRQANLQALAQQRAFALSASPNNAPAAARTAAIQMGRLNMGNAGAAAVAGLQERNQAMQQYGALGNALGQLQLGQRGQDLSGSLQGYGTVLNGQQNQSLLDRIYQAGGAGLGAL